MSITFIAFEDAETYSKETALKFWHIFVNLGEVNKKRPGNIKVLDRPIQLYRI